MNKSHSFLDGLSVGIFITAAWGCGLYIIQERPILAGVLTALGIAVAAIGYTKFGEIVKNDNAWKLENDNMEVTYSTLNRYKFTVRDQEEKIIALYDEIHALKGIKVRELRPATTPRSGAPIKSFKLDIKLPDEKEIT
jgi:hypothetical protein